MASTLKTELILSDSNFNAKLNSACNKAKASLNQIQQSTKGLSGILGNLSGQIGGLTGQLGGLLNSSKMLANPWVAAGAAALGAAKAFFDYNVELEKTRNLTSQFTGLTGNQLDSLNNGVRAVASTFGKDFREVLSGVDNLMNQFGIAGETALNIIQDGFVAGADDSGNFLENLQKYGPAFQEMGVSADQLVAILAQTRNGIFSEGGMASIQKAEQNIRTMSNSTKQSLAAIGISGDDMMSKIASGQMTTFDAIKQISGELKKLPPQSKEVGDVLKNVFGKIGVESGHEMIAALQELELDLEKVKEQTGEDGKVMEELSDATRDFNNACQSLFGVTDSGFSHLTDQLKISVMQALTKVINKFIELYNKSTLVRAGIAAIAFSFQATWTVIKTIVKNMVDAIEGLANVFEHLINLEWDEIPGDVKKTYKAIANNVTDAGKELAKAFEKGLQSTANGHINQVERALDPVKDKHVFDDIREKGEKSKYWTENRAEQVAQYDEEQKRKKEEQKQRRTPSSTKPEKGTGKGSGGKSTGSNNKPTFAKGSLSDLENQLSELQKKYKDGLIKITPENYQKQVKELEDKIEQKKIELKLAYDKESVQGLQQQLKKLQENQNSTNTELHLDTKEFKKQEADLVKKIQDKTVSLQAELDPDSINVIKQKLKNLQDNQVSENVYLHLDTKEFKKQEAELTKQLQDKELSIKADLDDSSLSVLEQKLKNLEENQISENVYLHIDGEEYRKQHKELERQIESERIKLGVSLSLEDADKQFTEMMKDYRKKSSFELATGPEEIKKGDYEGQLSYIQSQMDENDALLQQLKELQKAYKELGDAGAAGYATVSAQIANVTAEQQKLGQSAYKTNELSKSTQKLSKNFSESSQAVGEFGNVFSTLGSTMESPELNVMGIIAQAIAQVLQGAGTAIAESGSMGPFGWIGLAGTIMGIAASLISQIHSLSGYKGGGIIGGGKYVGDHNIIRANSGEMILNEGQQSRLFRILNGESSMQMAPAYSTGQVEFKIRGQELVGVLANYDRKRSKI